MQRQSVSRWRQLSERNECVQALIAQEKPSPNQDTDQGRHEDRLANAQLGDDCAAEITCEQDRSENRAARNHIDNGTGRLEDAQPKDEREY